MQLNKRFINACFVVLCVALLFFATAGGCIAKAKEVFKTSLSLGEPLEKVAIERFNQIMTKKEVEKVEKSHFVFSEEIQIATYCNNIAILHNSNVIQIYIKDAYQYSIKIMSSGIVNIYYGKNGNLFVANFLLDIIYEFDKGGNIVEAYYEPDNFDPLKYIVIDSETFEVIENFFGYKIYLRENGERTSIIESGGFLSGIWDILKYPLFIGANILLAYICIKCRKKFFTRYRKKNNK